MRVGDTVRYYGEEYEIEFDYGNGVFCIGHTVRCPPKGAGKPDFCDLAAYIFDSLPFSDTHGYETLAGLARRIAQDTFTNEIDTRTFFRLCGFSECDIETFVAR